MPHDLPKAYDPTAIEDHWAEYWVREKLFAQPAPSPGEPENGEPFVILLPPPNVTGNLHMGHMFEHTESDILIRWHRMRGDRVLWIPGTDHAGIATQMLVERQVASEGTTRQQLGREAFVARVWEWKRHYGGAILGQMKRLGASVDWQREYFTMSDELSVAVREAFVRLYEQGLIYRGSYIVNWCPRCQTAISDLEVVHEEQKGHIWEIRYPVVGPDNKDTGEFVTVATTRPETMLGDTAVAVHPEDERYLHFHGKKLRLPLVGREIPIILDDWVSRDFGTGAVKVTPAHDPNDFELGKRHNLPNINVMDETAHIKMEAGAEGGQYNGLDRYVARKRIVADLEAQGLLVAVKDHTSNIGHCDRCKTVVEPRLSTQWFVAVNKKPSGGGASIAEKAIAAVKPGPGGKKAIQFTPEQYEKTYLNWMENIYDWCISRQLWWGHRIPAWHCGTCGKITVPAPNMSPDPTACAHCGSDKLTQETDVLDTWFSSGLLPVSVFGWPNFGPHSVKGTGFSPYVKHPAGEGALAPEGHNRADFDAFYPTSLLVTGFDILFFWVARMIMLGCWFAGDIPMPDGSPRPLAESVPFKEVYIHALVRDANREKMSKTKGNVIDPIEIVKQYGTDAVRFTLASMASPGTDIAFNIARTEGYRAFANKIWNAARFIFMNRDRILSGTGGFLSFPRIDLRTIDRRNAIFAGSYPANPDAATADESSSPLEHRWIIARLTSVAAGVNNALENYRFDEAASVIYQFFWGDFCDWYLEMVKLPLDPEKPDGPEKTMALLVLVNVFESSLRLLSPFMPFITEELWHAFYDGTPPAKSIALMPYPCSADPTPDKQAEAEMALVQSLIVEVRALRKEIGVEEKIPTPIELRIDNEVRTVAEENRQIIERLAKVSEIRFVAQIAPGLPLRTRFYFDVAVVYQRTIDIPAERDRLTKDIAKYEKGIASAERQLGNDAFLQKAPPAVVEGLKKQEAETRLLLEKARAALDALPPEA
jgi:valyl-tRNA synthetase